MNRDIHPSIWLQPFMLLQSSRDASPLSRKSQQTIRHFFLNGTWEPAINSLLFYERSAPAFLINNPEPHFSSINVAQRPPSEQEHVNGAEKGKKGEKQQYTQAARISRFFSSFFFFFSSLWISGVCTSGLFTALGVQQILRWLSDFCSTGFMTKLQMEDVTKIVKRLLHWRIRKEQSSASKYKT